MVRYSANPDESCNNRLSPRVKIRVQIGPVFRYICTVHRREHLKLTYAPQRVHSLFRIRLLHPRVRNLVREIRLQPGME